MALSDQNDSLFRDLIWAFAISCLFVVGLCLLFEPTWQTNDDVWRSMIAHGYGFATQGSPELLRTNVIWGHLVRAIPSVNGVLGYSTATFASLIAFGIALVYAVRRMGLGWPLALALLVLILTRPVLSPQFTINAGLLTVGGVICACLYRHEPRIGTLVAGCILAFLGYLVRSQEFFFVMLVALPLLPWQTVFSDRSAKIAIFSLILAMAGAMFVNHLAYQGEEWRAFKEWTPVRVALLDYGKIDLIARRPEVLAQHGYSENDLMLVKNSFSIDPNISNPEEWSAMMLKSRVWPRSKELVAKAKNFISALVHDRRYWPMGLTGLLFFLLRPNPRVILAWALFVGAGIILAWLGRMPAFRVSFPVFALLAVAPCWISLSIDLSRVSYLRWIFLWGVILLALVNTKSGISRNLEEQSIARALRSDFASIPSEPKFYWGGWGMEKVYPVLTLTSDIFEKQFGWLTSEHNPSFNLSDGFPVFERFQDRYTSENGALIFWEKDKPYSQLLAIYCNERFGGTFQELESWETIYFAVLRVKCNSS